MCTQYQGDQQDDLIPVQMILKTNLVCIYFSPRPVHFCRMAIVQVYVRRDIGVHKQLEELVLLLGASRLNLADCPAKSFVFVC